MKWGCSARSTSRANGVSASFLESGRHRDLVRRQPVVEAQHRAGLAVDLVLVVGGEEERHHRPRRPGGRLDHVGHVALTARLVEVLELLPRVGGVLGQVVVPAVGDPLQLVPPPREEELDVRGAGRVVAELVGVVGPQPQLVLGDAEVEVPAEALLAPVLVPLLGLGRRHEVLHLHLLELAGAEHEVLRRDLVAERLADLGDPERRAACATSPARS
jgi:hypothetical protein